MGCIYNGYHGDCSLWDEQIEMNGCDSYGICICSEDPDPGVLCEAYESDWICGGCDADLNIEDCECDGEAEYRHICG